MAVLERMLKIMSAVQARMHASLKREFGLLKFIISATPPAQYEYNVEPDRMVKESDFERVDIIPVSDPNAATFSQRILQHQAALQLSQQKPELFDLPELYRGMIRLIGFENADKIVPKKDEIPYRDPVSENALILMGKPVKAFPEQDHKAHLQVHMASMQDPKVRQIVGQSPQAMAVQAAAEAHIAEHLGMQYRAEIQQALGIPLPPLGAPMDPMMENQLSRLMADASAKVLQKNQAEAAQQEAMAQAQDPLTQIQRQELQIKAADVDRKAKKDQSDAALKSAEIALKQAALDQKTYEDEQKRTTQQAMDGFKTGLEIQRAEAMNNKKDKNG